MCVYLFVCLSFFLFVCCLVDIQTHTYSKRTEKHATKAHVRTLAYTHTSTYMYVCALYSSVFTHKYLQKYFKLAWGPLEHGAAGGTAGGRAGGGGGSAAAGNNYYIYIYVYIHTYTYTQIYTYICIHIYTYINCRLATGFTIEKNYL